MKILNIIKSILFILTIIFIFFNWKIAIILFLTGSIIYVIPMGPNPLLSVVTGYLMIGGAIYLFINWKIGIALIISGFLVTKFRIYGNKCNYDYYEKNKNSDLDGKDITFFKEKILAEEMAVGLYHATVSNTVKNDLKDQGENVILTKKEQSLMLTQHLYDLLERNNLKKTKLYLLNTYVVNNHKIKTDNDLHFEMTISLSAIEKIRKFFREIPPESHKFFKRKFLFGKDLNPIQKTLAMQWYISHYKLIDSVFESGMKKFKLADDG